MTIDAADHQLNDKHVTDFPLAVYKTTTTSITLSHKCLNRFYYSISISDITLLDKPFTRASSGLRKNTFKLLAYMRV